MAANNRQFKVETFYSRKVFFEKKVNYLWIT